MDKRPDHIRCENCVFFVPRTPHPNAPDVMEGFCMRFPPDVFDGPCLEFPKAPAHSVQARVHGRNFCGEFRAEWPEEKQ